MITGIIRYSILLASAVFAQNIDPADIVDIRPTSTFKFINDGFEVSLNVHLAVKEQWHINSNEPVDKFLIPTLLLFDSSIVYYPKTTVYPPAKIAQLQFSKSDLRLYDGRSVIKTKIVVPKKYVKRTITITGTLQYQPCNNETCLFPVKKPFSITVQLKQ